LAKHARRNRWTDGYVILIDFISCAVIIAASRNAQSAVLAKISRDLGAWVGRYGNKMAGIEICPIRGYLYNQLSRLAYCNARRDEQGHSGWLKIPFSESEETLV
jgi:hypothetical protein